jgi:hypothetical protein
MNGLFNLEDRYKYEVQIDNRGKSFSGVTYSYKTTVFYGKASAQGTVNAKTGKVILEEMKLLELKMSEGSYACWMLCFMQYSKHGNEEFLEGKFSSYRESDSSDCGKGTVFLRKVPNSDFYKEPFLVNRENELAKKKEAERAKELAKNRPPAANTDKSKLPVKSPPIIKKATPPPAKTDVAKNSTPNKELPKTAQVTAKIEVPKTPSVIKTKPIVIPPILQQRKNEVAQTIQVTEKEITIDIYDNGTIDHDTVSVYLDKKLVLSKQMLKTIPLTLKLKLDDSDDYHELVMVAENLGEIPPNTSLMVVRAGDKRYEVRITSTEQKNAMVIFKYQKPNTPTP